jgi:hypothetical protein
VKATLQVCVCACTFMMLCSSACVISCDDRVIEVIPRAFRIVVQSWAVEVSSECAKNKDRAMRLIITKLALAHTYRNGSSRNP